MIEIIGLIIFAYLWPGHIKFVEDIKEALGFGEELKWKSKNKVFDYIIKFIYKIMNCYCIGFWLGWIFTGSFFIGLIVYFSAELLTILMEKIKSY